MRLPKRITKVKDIANNPLNYSPPIQHTFRAPFSLLLKDSWCPLSFLYKGSPKVQWKPLPSAIEGKSGLRKNVKMHPIHLIPWIWRLRTSGSHPKSQGPWELNNFASVSHDSEVNVTHKRTSRAATERSKNDERVLRGLNGSMLLSVISIFNLNID